MPRLLPTAPGLDVSRDHTWVARSTSTQLALYRTDTLDTAVAEAALAGVGPTELFFTGPPSPTATPRLIVFQQLGEVTLAVGYSVPALKIIGALELVGRVTPLATTHDRIFCCSVERDVPRLITFTARTLSVDPVSLRIPLEMAAAAPEGRFLVATRDGLEGWDPRKQRTVQRFNLPLRKPVLGGFANRERLFWSAMAGPSGPLEIYRFSDGRQQAHIEFGGPILGVASTPQSARLLVAFGGGSPGAPPQLHALDLMRQDRRELTLPNESYDEGAEDPVAAFALVDGDTPSVLFATAAGRLMLQPLPVEGAEPEDQAPEGTALRDGPVVLPNMPATSESSGWRRRAQPSEEDDNSEDDEENENAEIEADKEKPAIAAHPLPLSRPPARSVQPASVAPTAAAPKPAATVRPDHWRDALLAWSAGQQSLQLPTDSPLVRIAEQFGLPAAAALALAAVYASWLAGDGAQGAPAQTIAQAITTALGPPAARSWSEALNTGELARAGLTIVRHGRVKLRRVVARFLDQQPPRVTLREGPARPATPPPAGPHLVQSQGDLDRQLIELAARFGRLAVIDAAGLSPRQLTARLLEARLHAALPVLDARASGTVLTALPTTTAALVLVDGKTSATTLALPHLAAVG